MIGLGGTLRSDDVWVYKMGCYFNVENAIMQMQNLNEI